MAAYLNYCNLCDIVMWDDNPAPFPNGNTPPGDCSHDFDENSLGYDLIGIPEQDRHPKEHYYICPECGDDGHFMDVTLNNHADLLKKNTKEHE